MPTATRIPRTPRPGRTASAGRRAPVQSRYARPAPQRGQGLRRRKPPQQSGLKKVLGSVLPGAAVKKAAPSSKKGRAGGLALAAAAAGMAFRNRGKISQMRHKDDGGTPAQSTPTVVDNAASPPPATPPI